MALAPSIIEAIAPVGVMIALSSTIGWVVTTWMKVKNGYPLENSWGKAIYPRQTTEELERIKLLSQENAQLRAELGSVKDRLANVERIVTDEAHALNREIEQLRGKAN